MAEGAFSQFNYLVDLGGGIEGGFQEMSSLGDGALAIDDRTSDGPGFFRRRKLSGIAPRARVVLKRGLVTGGAALRDWQRAALRGGAERRTIRIRLRDERHENVASWTLAEAWPAEIAGPGPHDAAAQDPVESLVLACAGIAADQG